MHPKLAVPRYVKVRLAIFAHFISNLSDCYFVCSPLSFHLARRLYNTQLEYFLKAWLTLETSSTDIEKHLSVNDHELATRFCYARNSNCCAALVQP